MLPADYAGAFALFVGVGLAFRGIAINDVALMWIGVGVAAVGTVLKVGSTRYKGRIDRERREAERDG